VGEDADLTMKLRRAGWEIRFAPEAHALTGAPETVAALITQRLRWDRGLVTIWMRKFRGAFDSRQATFRIIDVVAVADVLVFQVALAVMFPIYLAWLLYYFGEFAMTIIAATFIVYSVLDLFAFANATALGLRTPFRLLPYLPLYTILQASVFRIVRLIALAQEFIFRSSYRDPYVPPHIMRQVEMV
jgi:poly-beta-1,6-N-acetyl-D-glucosamine synthase